jgi:hypothetical protein
MGSSQLGAAGDYWASTAVPVCYTAAEDMWGSAVAAGLLVPAKQRPLFIYFKLSLASECHTLSFGLFPDICSLNANVSEHSVSSIFIGRQSSYLPAYVDGTECSETLAFKPQTPENHPEENI